MKKEKDPVVLVGLDNTGFFRIPVPPGGRFTVAPAGQGLGPYVLRIYKDKTNNSMVLFQPGISWVREEGLPVLRPVDDPDKIVSLLFEITGIALTPGVETPQQAWTQVGQTLGTAITKAVEQSSPFYTALKTPTPTGGVRPLYRGKRIR